MKTPPIEWEDLYAFGVASNASMAGGQSGYTVDPQPPRLVRQLLAELAARPAPEGDRLAYLRHVRDLLMGLTDYTQANDSPLSETQRAAWATYRQALRDLPSVYSGEGPIPWPQEPA
jgi:hypothetical protein